MGKENPASGVPTVTLFQSIEKVVGCWAGATAASPAAKAKGKVLRAAANGLGVIGSPSVRARDRGAEGGRGGPLARGVTRGGEEGQGTRQKNSTAWHPCGRRARFRQFSAQPRTCLDVART